MCQMMFTKCLATRPFKVRCNGLTRRHGSEPIAKVGNSRQATEVARDKVLHCQTYFAQARPLIPNSFSQAVRAKSMM
jgi:hypothetical protein